MMYIVHYQCNNLVASIRPCMRTIAARQDTSNIFGVAGDDAYIVGV